MFNKKIKTIIKVEGMSCNHCADKVTKALESLDDIRKVKVNLKNNSVTILSDKELNIKVVESTINSLEYKYEGLSNEENQLAYSYINPNFNC